MRLSVLIRPREGDFVYSAGEFDEVLADIGAPMRVMCYARLIARVHEEGLA